MGIQKFRLIRLCLAAALCVAHFFITVFCAGGLWELRLLDAAGYGLICIVAHMAVRRMLPQGLFNTRPAANALADTLIYCAVCAALSLTLLCLRLLLIFFLCLLGYGPAPT